MHDTDQHHRRSIRLAGYDYASDGWYYVTVCSWKRDCLFGAVIDGAMRLNAAGEAVVAAWQSLPARFPLVSRKRAGRVNGRESGRCLLRPLP